MPDFCVAHAVHGHHRNRCRAARKQNKSIPTKNRALKAKKPPPCNPLLVEVVLKRRMHFVKVRPDLCIPVPLPCRPHTRHARDTSSRAVWQSNEARAMTISAGRRLASIVT